MTTNLFSHCDILDTEQFSRDDLELILDYSHRIHKSDRSSLSKLLDKYILASLFFEASTRTRLSFETAMHRLGGKVITTVGFQFSSINKGESLYDTMKMIEAYADIVVIRHPTEGSSHLAADASSIPLINAGDGVAQHPTQALLDLYTIFAEKSNIEGLRIAFVGDLKYGRTIHSLIQLLCHYKVELVLISPADLSLPEQYLKNIRESELNFIESEDLKDILDCDVVYVTRIQEERFTHRSDYERLKDSYTLNRDFLQLSPKLNELLIMHPLPRVKELSTDLDDLPNAAYFRMAHYGVSVRMALLLLCLQVSLP